MSELRPEKAAVQSFYDEFGWLEDDSTHHYMDACVYEDLRPTTMAYRTRANARVGEALQQGGDFLLDIASGPIQYDDYVRFSDGYGKRVCVDLSIRGLQGARKRIGEHGLFVQGDITRIPFREDAFDSVVSLHTIYHVPADEQQDAVKEIVRTLKPGRHAAVVYVWPSLLSRVKRTALRLPGLGSFVRRMRRSSSDTQSFETSTSSSSSLYFHPHSLRWFRRWFDSLSDMEIRCWRSVTVPFLKWVPEGRFGELLLNSIGFLEDRWPHLLGRIGKYPLIIITKSAAGQESKE